MANTFFEFDTTTNNGDNLLPDDEDCLENEEEYDALNDETFGAIDASGLDDWEQQHEQFAELTESVKHSEQIENSISQLVLDDSDDAEIESETPISLSKNSVWSYTPETKNGDVFNNTILSSLQKASKSFIETHSEPQRDSPHPPNATPIIQLFQGCPLKKICTVEELEKSLIQSSNRPSAPLPNIPMGHGGPPGGHPQRPPQMPVPLGPPMPMHPMMQHPNTRMPPPGLGPMGIPPPGMRHMPSHPMLPPGMMRMMPPHPHFMANGPPRGPPGFMGYPPQPPINNQLPVNHPYNFPPHPNMQNMAMMKNMPRGPHNLQNMQHSPPNHRQRHDSDRGNYKQHHQMEHNQNRDEYSGLMTAREKQWLLNIQLLQLNTGMPYFDDYYYTIFKERKLKNNKENLTNVDRNQRFGNRQRKNSERQENNTLTPRVYTPLQFENSLGKLQCGSVTAPRKIIDMDIVTPDKDGDGPSASRDTRKTKQLLLELEALYSLLLHAEDIKNPMFIGNMEKWRELKQKQRLRELELAPTPEQKQEVLKLFKQESEPVVENQMDYITRIVTGLLQEDKFASFLNIRKGKMLLLRTLPYLTPDIFSAQLVEIWSRVLLSLPITGRRDTAGDNLLPKLLPYFKKYVQTVKMSDILDIVSGLIEVIKQENSRSTPLSHAGKAPLYFVLLNKFGVSALSLLLIRCEYLMSSEKASEPQRADWSDFLAAWARQTEAVAKAATPLESVPSQILAKHCNRFPNLKSDKRALLERHLAAAAPT